MYVPATATDAKIAGLAAGLGASVLARDQDFAALLSMAKARAPSLINLRHPRTNSELLVELLDGVLRQHAGVLLGGAILTVDERGVRIHMLPIGRATS